MKRKSIPGDFVIVNYEEEYFPGTVIQIRDGEAYIKTMQMSGQNWKWPEKEDVIWYKDEEICTFINPPSLLNIRGIYAVPEIESLRKA
jgi:hypothetical protein